MCSTRRLLTRAAVTVPEGISRALNSTRRSIEQRGFVFTHGFVSARHPQPEYQQDDTAYDEDKDADPAVCPLRSLRCTRALSQNFVARNLWLGRRSRSRSGSRGNGPDR